MSDSGGYQKLPPGWDCKYDQTTGNCYYINYLTKAMQLEDPRGRYKQLQNERCSSESIALQHIGVQPTTTATTTMSQQQQQQSSYGNSPYHVYPSNNLTAVRAFQERNHQLQPSLHNISSSPLLSASSRGHLEMSSPLAFQRTRAGHMTRRSTIQETSFTNQIDTDAVVSKIQNMFPTAGENHIRLLLKRYYNREAVVISALQVEKHPVTMPGPFVTPPAQRHLFHSNSAFYMTPPARRLDMGASRGALSTTSRTASPMPPGGRFGSVMSMHSGGGHGVASAIVNGSPMQWRSSPKPHSSPKMKLRYMKNIFPKADEMLLLDILANSDNNVQYASEKLITLGYTKREMQPHKPNNRPPQLEQAVDVDKALAPQHIPLRPAEYTAEEKTAMQSLLKQKYPQIAERIILMALESVNYAEDRAIQILQIVQDEEAQRVAQNTKVEGEPLPLMERDAGQSEQVDGNATDSILTVVVETTTKQPRKQHQRHILPSINVTTPTTATTQIILSSVDVDKPSSSTSPPPPSSMISPISTIVSGNSSANSNSSITHSYASPSPLQSIPQSATGRYERMTTKSILARSSGCSGGGSLSFNSNKHHNNSNNNYSINGYLHGSISNSNNNASSSYSSYTTRTTTSMSKTSSSLSSSVNSNPSSITSKLTTAIGSHVRTKTNSLKQMQRASGSESAFDADGGEFQSLIERMATMGPNSQLSKGADEHLLLADYVTWNGPNTALSQKQTAHGPDASLLGDHNYKATGRNNDLCKGPNSGLAKGSIYTQGGSTSTNIKCN